MTSEQDKQRQRDYYKTYYILNRNRILEQRRLNAKLHPKIRNTPKRKYVKISNEIFKQALKQRIKVLKNKYHYGFQDIPFTKKIQKTKSLILSFDD
jgi:hypothetical protein